LFLVSIDLFVYVFLYRNTFDLQGEPVESNKLLVESDCTTVPWIPLTPTLLLPFHIDFKRVPLTFCPRTKRKNSSFTKEIFVSCFVLFKGQLDIEISIPSYRIPREPVNKQQAKQKKKAKKKANQRRKRNQKNSGKDQ